MANLVTPTLEILSLWHYGLHITVSPDNDTYCEFCSRNKWLSQQIIGRISAVIEKLNQIAMRINFSYPTTATSNSWFNKEG